MYGGCQWRILIVLAKLTSTEQVGVFGQAMGQRTSGPIVLLSHHLPPRGACRGAPLRRQAHEWSLRIEYQYRKT